MIDYHSASDIAVLQQHDKVQRGEEKIHHPARPSSVARCTVDNDISLFVFILPGYLLSATMCRVDCQAINAGVITLGESPRLVAAGGLVDPKLYTKYELTYDPML